MPSRRSEGRRRSRRTRRSTRFARRLLLPAFAPRPSQALEPVTRQLCRDLLDADRRRRRVRCRRRLRAGHPRPPSSPACSGSRPRTTSASGASSTTCWSRSPTTRSAVRARRGPRLVHRPPHRRPRRAPSRRPHQLPARRRDRRGAGCRPSTCGDDRAPPDRRHRHDVERDRRRAVAPGHARRRPPPARRRTGAACRGRRGAAAGLRPGHDGPDRGRGHRAAAAAGWPRATGCCCPSRPPTAIPRSSRTPTRSCIDRAVNRHAAFGLGIHRCLGSNLARMELTRRPRGVDGALPGLRAGRPRRRHVVGRAGPRPSPPARAPPRPRLNQGRPRRPDAPSRSLGTEACTPSSGFRSVGCTLADATMMAGPLRVVRRPRRGGRRRRRSGPRPGASRR